MKEAKRRDLEVVVVTVRYKSSISWFRSNRDLWILDYNKWHNEFINAGYKVSQLDEDDRFGIHIVNNQNSQQFLDFMSKFKIHQDKLSLELAIRFQTASS